MTNDELLTDLKQFIDATVSQATAGLATAEALEALETKMNQRFKEVNQHFEDVDVQLNEIQNAVGSTLEETDATVQQHGKRLTRLEHKLA